MKGTLAAAANTWPERPALITDSAVLTYAALASAVERERRTVVRTDQDPVVVVARPDLAGVIQVWSVLELGAPLAVLDPNLRGDLLAARRVSLSGGPASPREPAVMVFTSGTTGGARPVRLSSRALAAAARASEAHLGWTPADRWQLTLPLSHVGGLMVLVRCALAGRPVVLDERRGPFDAERSLANLRAGRVTLTSVVPTQLRDLLDTGQRPPPALRAVLVGGAPASPALLAEAYAAGWPVRATYGLSETCGQIATAPAGPPEPSGAIGPALPGLEVSVREGQVHARGPSLFDGYGVGETAAPLDAEGWFATGDLGELDGQGWLRVLGRADDVIVTGGEKVHPAEIEAVLEALPGVARACVFGVPDPRWGQRVSAALVPRNELRPGDLLPALGAQLAPHQRPRLWALVSSLPLGPTGKVDRRAVRVMVEPRLAPLDGVAAACGGTGGGRQRGNSPADPGGM